MKKLKNTNVINVIKHSLKNKFYKITLIVFMMRLKMKFVIYVVKL